MPRGEHVTGTDNRKTPELVGPRLGSLAHCNRPGASRTAPPREREKALFLVFPRHTVSILGNTPPLVVLAVPALAPSVGEIPGPPSHPPRTNAVNVCRTPLLRPQRVLVLPPWPVPLRPVVGPDPQAVFPFLPPPSPRRPPGRAKPFRLGSLPRPSALHVSRDSAYHVGAFRGPGRVPPPPWVPKRPASVGVARPSVPSGMPSTGHRGRRPRGSNARTGCKSHCARRPSALPPPAVPGPPPFATTRAAPFLVLRAGTSPCGPPKLVPPPVSPLRVDHPSVLLTPLVV